MRLITLAAAIALLTFGAASQALAQSYAEFQSEFLWIAAEEEDAEHDPWSYLRFRNFAESVDESGRAITRADLPRKWQDESLVRRDQWVPDIGRLHDLERRLDSVDSATRQVNLRQLARAEVCSFHARHEFSESLTANYSAREYLDCMEDALSNLRPADTDGDGLTDDRDRCPAQPEDFDGYRDRDGCPDPDNDRDGIPDVRDNCPDEPETFNGYNDRDGCPDNLAFEPVYFRLDSSALDARAIDAISRIAAFLKDSNGAGRLSGHCSSESSERYNQSLGMRRAEAVRDYLVRYAGIDPHRLDVVSMGEHSPAASNATAEGRSLNRRVEFQAAPIVSRR